MYNPKLWNGLMEMSSTDMLLLYMQNRKGSSKKAALMPCMKFLRVVCSENIAFWVISVIKLLGILLGKIAQALSEWIETANVKFYHTSVWLNLCRVCKSSRFTYSVCWAVNLHPSLNLLADLLLISEPVCSAPSALPIRFRSHLSLKNDQRFVSVPHGLCNSTVYKSDL